MLLLWQSERFTQDAKQWSPFAPPPPPTPPPAPPAPSPPSPPPPPSPSQLYQVPFETLDLSLFIIDPVNHNDRDGLFEYSNVRIWYCAAHGTILNADNFVIRSRLDLTGDHDDTKGWTDQGYSPSDGSPYYVKGTHDPLVKLTDWGGVPPPPDYLHHITDIWTHVWMIRYTARGSPQRLALQLELWLKPPPSVTGSSRITFAPRFLTAATGIARPTSCSIGGTPVYLPLSPWLCQSVHDTIAAIITLVTLAVLHGSH